MAVQSEPTAGRVEAQNSFGDLAVASGFATAAQVEECMRIQAAAAKAGFRKRLGDVMIQKGYLTPAQVHEILSQQKVEGGRKRVGNFEVLTKLGEGSMGAVFRARQLGMDRDVALKLLAPHLARDPMFRERFVREARAVAKLNHPHIVSGIDAGVHEGAYYLAMEFVDGESLGERIEIGGRLPEREALEFSRQIALALDHAHTQGFLHRDVKPDNILVNRRGVAKLADLGIARLTRRGATLVSERGRIVGTPFYMSPEQARGQGELTPATDLYSLGATLFHLLTGRPPFEGADYRAILYKHCKEAAPDPRRYNPGLSAGAAAICLKLLQKSPAERYTSGESLAEDLARVLQNAAPLHASARPATTPPPAPARPRPPEAARHAPVPAGARPSAPGAAVARDRAARRTRAMRPQDRSHAGLAIVLLGVFAAVLAIVLVIAYGYRTVKPEATPKGTILPFRRPPPPPPAPEPAPTPAPPGPVESAPVVPPARDGAPVQPPAEKPKAPAPAPGVEKLPDGRQPVNLP